MTLPKPGEPVRGSRTGRPIMALLDLLGRRWVLRILWELRETQGAALSFRELRDRCDAMSPTVLNQRLKELRDAEIVVLVEGSGYTVTRSGRQLLEALMPLQHWSKQWQKRMSKREADET